MQAHMTSDKFNEILFLGRVSFNLVIKLVNREHTIYK